MIPLLSAFRVPAPARAALLGLAVPLAALVAPTPAAGQQPVAFVDVHVIPMDGERVLPRQTVVVRDGRIARMGPRDEVRVPEGARVVAGRGKYLIPGLAEMHAHIPTPQAGEATINRTLFLYLAGGVTTIRGMLGHPRHLELREQAARGEILAPRIYTSGPSLNGSSAPDPETAARLVEEQKAAGYDFLKLHPGLSRAAFDAVDAAADRVGIPFSGHVAAEVGLRRALEAGYASIDHLDGYVEALAGHGERYDARHGGLFGIGYTDQIDLDRIPELAAATREAGVWNVPTQTLLEHLASERDPEQMAKWPEMRYMPPRTVAQWIQSTRDYRRDPRYSAEAGERYLEARRRLLRELQASGAGLLLGSDAPQWWNVPGFSVRRELEYLVAAGLTPYQALETGTRNPARFFGAEGEWGTVRPHAVADLILLDANPLEDIRNLWQQAGVMVRGRWLPQAEIQQRLDRIAAAVR